MSLILFFDTETSKWPIWKEPSANPDQPHIVQIAAKLVDSETRKCEQAISLTVRPDGWDIYDATVEIHGITAAHAGRVGISEIAALQIFQVMEARADLRVAYNEPFDRRIVKIALHRFFGKPLAEEWKARPGDCAMRMATPICAMPDPKGKKKYKWPKLSEAYEIITGNALEGAHDAMVDVDALIEIYWMMKDEEG